MGPPMPATLWLPLLFILWLLSLLFTLWPLLVSTPPTTGTMWASVRLRLMPTPSVRLLMASPFITPMPLDTPTTPAMWGTPPTPPPTLDMLVFMAMPEFMDILELSTDKQQTSQNQKIKRNIYTAFSDCLPTEVASKFVLCAMKEK